MDALEARLRAVEDQLSILQVIASYGPGIDAGDGALAASLWTDDGVYDVGGLERLEGSEAIAALADRPAHQARMSNGCSHIASLPIIKLAGDTAVATNYSIFLVSDGGAYTVHNVRADRWELVRDGGAWKVQTRTNERIDGGIDARDLLRRGFD